MNLGSIFNYDNKFFQFINQMVDCIFVSLLFLVCSLPVITAGTAATALYYTVNKAIIHGEGYVFRSFIKAFRANLKQTVILWLISLGLLGFLFIDLYLTYQMLVSKMPVGYLFYFFLVFFVFLSVWICYLFAYTARFENTTKEILKNVTLIFIAHLPFTLLIAVILLLAAGLLYLVLPTVLIVPAAVMVSINPLLERIFRKYMRTQES